MSGREDNNGHYGHRKIEQPVAHCFFPPRSSHRSAIMTRLLLRALTRTPLKASPHVRSCCGIVGAVADPKIATIALAEDAA
jgi:hypothetical protein